MDCCGRYVFDIPVTCHLLQGRCSRENCKYLHPPSHLKTQLEINGRNNLIQQKTAAAVLAQQMQFMIPGTSMPPVVSPLLLNTVVAQAISLLPSLPCAELTQNFILMTKKYFTDGINAQVF